MSNDQGRPVAAVAVALPPRSLRPRFDQPPPLGLYVHLPWCLRKCPYCDFNSHGLRPGDDVAALEAGYVDALVADLESSLPMVWGRTVGSVFIGGGTPSLFSPAAIDRLLVAIRARLPLAPDVEITLEANPGTFERERFEGFRAAGVNRLSLGVQSFDDRLLAAIGRVHDGAQARAAAASAVDLFERVNLDLMFALPGQTPADLDADLETVLSFGAGHLSIYHLTLEPNTLFARFPPALPDEDTAAGMQERIEGVLGAAGFGRYEVSAFARPGERSRHNLNYWQFGDYLGIGAGAHGKLSLQDRIVRQVRWKHPARYREAARSGNPIEIEHDVAGDDIAFEFMLNALRLVDGVPTDLFTRHAGLPLARIGRPLAEAVARGLLDPDPGRLKATPLGLRFLNDTQSLFLPAPAQPAP
jgi:putative oxygen-independent coproporphyrinogen III oxidase